MAFRTVQDFGRLFGRQEFLHFWHCSSLARLLPVSAGMRGLLIEWHLGVAHQLSSATLGRGLKHFRQRCSLTSERHPKADMVSIWADGRC